MKFFWFKKPYNYGDVMTPYICNQLNIRCEFARREKANAIMIGSIANQALPGMHVFGSGFIRGSDVPCKDAVYHWVRGPRSRQMLLAAGVNTPELYGDAALLMPDFGPARKRHDIGFVPHHVDYTLVGQGFKVDLSNGSIPYITNQISQCRKIISSSLHGIVVAHAYGIPAAWVKLSDKLKGDDMKFHDHYESVGLKAVLSTVDAPVFQEPANIEVDHIRRLLVENVAAQTFKWRVGRSVRSGQRLTRLALKKMGVKY